MPIITMTDAIIQPIRAAFLYLNIWYDTVMTRGTKRKIRTLGIILATGILLICIGYLIYKIYTVALERYQINKQISTVEEKLQNLDTKNKDLKALVTRLQDSSYLEKEARKKLNVQLPGEQAVIITGQGATKPSVIQKDTSSQSTALAHAKQWYEILFGE